MKDYAKERKTDLIIVLVTAIFIAFFVNLFFIFKDQIFKPVDDEPVPKTFRASAPIKKKTKRGKISTDGLTTLPSDTTPQTIIEDWINSTSGEKGIILYDVDYDQIIGEYNSEEYFNMASLYKLFVVYEGYNKIQNGEWQEDDEIIGYTTKECLDLAIRESYSPCAEALWDKIGSDYLDEKYQVKISDIVSNPKEILKIMKLFYDYEDPEHPELIENMWDSFLNQPETSYNWRQGLPSGFSDKTRVYNKVGWDYNPAGYWNAYHDAAIIETENGHHYIIVIMTSQIDPKKIGELGQKLEEIL